MAELSRITVVFEQYAVDREQRRLQEKFARGARLPDEFLAQMETAEHWARRYSLGQQMFELVADTLFVERLSLADYMRAVDRVTRNPRYTPDQRLALQNELKKYIDMEGNE